jgi:hypothetical protein
MPRIAVGFRMYQKSLPRELTPVSFTDNILVLPLEVLFKIYSHE